MAHGINIIATPLTPTGNVSSFAQHAMDVSITWIDDAGKAQSWTGTLTIPDDVVGLSEEHLNMVREYIAEMLVARKRVELGIDAL